MSALMEHHDYKSARRALIAGSIAVYVISDLTLLNTEIEIFKLKLLVSQEKIAFYGSFGIVYLLYIFTIRVLELFPTLDKNLLSELEHDYLEFFDENSVVGTSYRYFLERIRAQKTSSSEQRTDQEILDLARDEISRPIVDIQFRIRAAQSRRLQLYFLEIAPVYFIALFSFYAGTQGYSAGS